MAAILAPDPPFQIIPGQLETVVVQIACFKAVRPERVNGIRRSEFVFSRSGQEVKNAARGRTAGSCCLAPSRQH
jgi:hypothetical protein